MAVYDSGTGTLGRVCEDLGREGARGEGRGDVWKRNRVYFFADAQQARLSFSPCVAFVVWAVVLVNCVFVDSGSVSIKGDCDSIFYPLQQ